MQPYQKRAELRRLIDGNDVIMIPGAFNAKCAEIIENIGFSAAYVSGAATSVGVFAFPDLGLYTLTEMCKVAEPIIKATKLPVICDADTGFGGVLNVRRTVQEFEEIGAAGIHIEDQKFPKRCGHDGGKNLVSEDEMVDKIEVALGTRYDSNFIIIARSDAYDVEDFDGLLRRCEAYVDAGADMIFPEALRSLEEYERVVSALGDTPVLANMTEFGKTPYYTVRQFGEVGCRAVLFPLTIFRVAMKAAQEEYENISKCASI